MSVLHYFIKIMKRPVSDIYDIDQNLGTAIYQVIWNEMCATITENLEINKKRVQNNVKFS